MIFSTPMIARQGLSQELETGCAPRIGNWGILLFKGDLNIRYRYYKITTIYMCLVIGLRHNIRTLFHWNYIGVEKNFIKIIRLKLKLAFQEITHKLIFLRVIFESLCVQNDAMIPCWLRLEYSFKSRLFCTVHASNCYHAPLHVTHSGVNIQDLISRKSVLTRKAIPTPKYPWKYFLNVNFKI